MSDAESDSRSRPERLMNLLIMLLVQNQFVSKEKIRTALYAEPAGPAFDRMFDRDKELLRDLGVPIETGFQDAWFEDEPGYRIKADEFALPAIEFTADEAAVVSLAAKVWQHAAMADAATQAVRKLQPLMSQETDHPAPPVRLPALESAVLTADEPAFDAVWSATQEHRRITFDYRRSGATEVGRRHVEPWGLVRQEGRWYVVGHDVDRADQRVFRLSRIVGPVRAGREIGAFTVPDHVDLQSATRRVAPAHESIRAELLLREGRGWGLRRHAAETLPDVPGPDRETAWDSLVLSGALGPLTEQILALGADVVVRSPDVLRDRVVQRLTRLATTDPSAGDSVDGEGGAA